VEDGLWLSEKKVFDKGSSVVDGLGLSGAWSSDRGTSVEDGLRLSEKKVFDKVSSVVDGLGLSGSPNYV
jgi:hypothetical protein